MSASSKADTGSAGILAGKLRQPPTCRQECRRSQSRWPIAAVVCASLMLAAGAGAVGLGQSKHNFSPGGPGALSAAINQQNKTSEMCAFCHTPHTAAKPGLWNRADSGVVYTPYRSSTMKASVGQPTGASKLCLSCHDGTVALGQVRGRSGATWTKALAPQMPAGRSNLGTDLSDDHPVSFQYNAALVAANGQLQSPPMTGPVHLDANGQLQCTSCHDPHNDANGKFLVMNNTASALCLTCHNMTFWRQSSHSLSTRPWNGNSPNPWPHTKERSVGANACENCHDPHGAGGRQRLLNYAAEEQNCYPCHNGNVAAKNIQAEFSKSSVHPVVTTSGLHDPNELAQAPGGAGRHVACSDCHNPHAANNTAAPRGGLSGALAGVRGVSASGANLSRITSEYELCFRCHADTAKGPARVNRQYPQLNTRLEFQNSGGTNSFHPVVFVGRNGNVPSLKPPWTSASRIGCGDCHNSDQGPGAGGSGPAGPHGSVYPPLLERMLNLSDTGSNPANSALCFKCHNFVNTAWSRHVEHLGMTSCMTCHDPHGAPNAHLINFNPSIVTGPRAYTARGIGHGTCVLSCHGKEHNSKY